ncbi:MAG: ATP-binding cassette domain-containing protein, partial [Candidatus Natronoplasma sp.]
MTVAVEASNLSKTFGDVEAVKDVSFTVEKGEFFGFLGPNGAGKTTTIRMLTGLITPDSGKASIDGIDPHKDPIHAKMEMGIIPEFGNIYVDLTAKENLHLAGKFYG